MIRRSKGAAGMGARGSKNKSARVGAGGANKRKRNTGGGATLDRPSSPRANQGRNQKQWAKKKKTAQRY